MSEKLACRTTRCLNPGPLNAAQWRAIKQHVVMSYRLLSGVEFLNHAAAVAYAHHERLDGSGYPRGLRGDEIPFGARVFAVADAYDAMTSNRPYQKAMPPEAARAEMERCAGAHFDPEVVEAFCRVAPQLPQGRAA